MRDCSYSCNSASETLEWIISITNFIEPYRFLIEAHVVNFYKDRLWETVDEEWMDYLRRESIDNLLLVPSGVVQDHWPISLKEFVHGLAKLSLPRCQADLKEVFPCLGVAKLNKVISQGMNEKKNHEIEVLGAVINSVARRVGAQTVLDVGSGQGYLAQVLSFEHELSVVAIDSSSHHGSVTDARAKRIEKYYRARKSKSRSKDLRLSVPKTMTCRVLSPSMLRDVSNSLMQVVELHDSDDKPLEKCLERVSFIPREGTANPSLVLAGLHACGDLSVTMLRTFVQCDEVKAVVSIGCCYNLLTEGECTEAERESAFPLSSGAKSAGLAIGKSARDLACQSADRWRGLGQVAGLHNFELHACRAALQMVLSQYYPEVVMKSPSIGRQGKALRRQHSRRGLHVNAAASRNLPPESLASFNPDPLLQKPSSNSEYLEEDSKSADRFDMFMKFCDSGLDRLGLHDHHDIDFLRLWNEVDEFSGFIGPYWTLRAALGPVLETLLLLDRLLFLQEHGDMLRNVVMLPLFDPLLSPRNVALIAEKL